MEGVEGWDENVIDVAWGGGGKILRGRDVVGTGEGNLAR